jgi:hypothetical protein
MTTDKAVETIRAALLDKRPDAPLGPAFEALGFLAWGSRVVEENPAACRASK